MKSLPPLLLQLNITLEKEVAGFWIKVPCVEELGSCHYRDACDVLNQLIPPGQDCPEPLHTYGLPCRCPFKDVSVLLPSGRDKLWNVLSTRVLMLQNSSDVFFDT